MNINKIRKLKGFMPDHEGDALMKWSEKFSKLGPGMEIGTYCGKSTMYLSKGAYINNQNVFTIDHHLGSEEHQINEEYFDEEIYDYTKKRVNTLPLLIKNINDLGGVNIIPIFSDSVKVSKSWFTDLGMVFIDGGHSFESANNDFSSWESKILTGGSLVIHDIYENPHEGGQAPFEVYKKALQKNYKEYERVDTIVCLIKG